MCVGGPVIAWEYDKVADSAAKTTSAAGAIRRRRPMIGRGANACPTSADERFRGARPPQLETPFSVYDEGPITPNDAFFIRYHPADAPVDGAEARKILDCLLAAYAK